MRQSVNRSVGRSVNHLKYQKSRVKKGAKKENWLVAGMISPGIKSQPKIAIRFTLVFLYQKYLRSH